MSETLAANRSRRTKLVRGLRWRMPTSVKRRLSRLRAVRLVRADSSCRPASPTPARQEMKKKVRSKGKTRKRNDKDKTRKRKDKKRKDDKWLHLKASV